MDTKTKPGKGTQSKKVTLTFEASTIKYNHMSQIYTITFKDHKSSLHKVIMHAENVATDYIEKIPSSKRAISTPFIKQHKKIKPSNLKKPNKTTNIVSASNSASPIIKHNHFKNDPKFDTLTYRRNILFLVLEAECKASCAIDFNEQLIPTKQQILSDLKLNDGSLKKGTFSRCMKNNVQMKIGSATKIYKLYQRRIKEWEEANPELIQRPLVFWLWCNEHGISSFDDETQLQIEQEMQSLLAKKGNEAVFFLNRGSWFSRSMNYMRYEIRLVLEYKNGLPVLQKSTQRNTKSNFVRNIIRVPPLISLQYMAIYKTYSAIWMWSDEHEWRIFNWECIQELEKAFSKHESIVKLTTGWFAQHVNIKGGYHVKIHYECRPTAGQQMNPNNSYERPVRRIPYTLLKEIYDNNSQKIKSKIKSDKDWRSIFRPLSIRDWNKQTSDNEQEKNKFQCSICLEEFRECILLENQKKHIIVDVNVIDEKKEAATMNDSIDGEWKVMIKTKFCEIFSQNEFDSKIANDFDTDIMAKLTLEKFFAGDIKKVHFNKIFKKYGCKAGPCGQLHSALKEGEHFMETKKKLVIKTNMHDDSLLAFRDEIKDTTVVSLVQCMPGHYFHSLCITTALSNVSRCPNCQKIYEVIIGPQPIGYFVAYPVNRTCKGFEDYGSIVINMAFPAGVQSNEHGNPGHRFQADTRCAFLPNNVEGRESFVLIRMAFQRKLLFTVGRSLTSGKSNQIIFQSIHLKTRMDGGQQSHGYPDPEYFQRLKDELVQKYVTVDQLSDNDREFIKNGFA